MSYKKEIKRGQKYQKERKKKRGKGERERERERGAVR